MRTLVSFVLAFVVLYLVYRQVLDLDWREVWASMRGANAGLLVLSFAVFYCSYLFRALRILSSRSRISFSTPTSFGS